VLVRSLCSNLPQALVDLERRYIGVESEDDLAKVRGGGLFKFASYITKGFVVRPGVDLFRMAKYMATRFMIDFPGLVMSRHGTPAQLQAINDYLAAHYTPMQLAPRYGFLQQVHLTLQMVRNNVHGVESLLENIVFVQGYTAQYMGMVTQHHQHHGGWQQSGQHQPQHQHYQHQPHSRPSMSTKPSTKPSPPQEPKLQQPPDQASGSPAGGDTDVVAYAVAPLILGEVETDSETETDSGCNDSSEESGLESSGGMRGSPKLEWTPRKMRRSSRTSIGPEPVSPKPAEAQLPRTGRGQKAKKRLSAK